MFFVARNDEFLLVNDRFWSKTQNILKNALMKEYFLKHRCSFVSCLWPFIAFFFYCQPNLLQKCASEDCCLGIVFKNCLHFLRKVIDLSAK